MLTDEEFRQKFFAEASDLRKIKLALREDRYVIIKRQDKPNLPASFLAPILDLPANHKVEKKARKSGRQGSAQILVVRYTYKGMGKEFEIYLKAYFAMEGEVEIELEVQSLRENT